VRILPDSLRRRRIFVLAASFVLVALGASAWSLGHRGGSSDDLTPRHPSTVFGTDDLTPTNSTFSVVTAYIRAPGKTVEILRVQPVTTPNVTYLGAITVWPRDFKDSGTDGGMGFPTESQHTTHPALGVVVPASETTYTEPGNTDPTPLTVNAGFRLSSGDAGAVNGVKVTYRVGKKVKSERSRWAVVVCMKPCKRFPRGNLLEQEAAVLAIFGMKETDA